MGNNPSIRYLYLNPSWNLFNKGLIYGPRVTTFILDEPTLRHPSSLYYEQKVSQPDPVFSPNSPLTLVPTRDRMTCTSLTDDSSLIWIYGKTESIDLFSNF